MKKEYICPIEISTEIIGGKWKPWILWYLREKPKRHSELKKEVSNISARILTQQLRELEEKKIVNRKVYAQVPPKVEYSLTELGKELEPVLLSMVQWGKRYQKEFNLKCLNEN